MFNRTRFRPRFRGGLSASPSLALDFLSGALDPRFTFTRASAGWDFNSAGDLAQYATNVPRFGFDQSTLAARGLLMEGARTNIALWSRDFTNAAWVKTNTTTALDVTGIDGAANTASRLTATAAGGTALQTITSASANHVTSFFVRRVLGSGTVEITQDNGATWTAIAVTPAWQRFAIPTATITNPVIGFRLGTNGDVIAVDAAQTEVEAFPTSPILTTSAIVTRAVDTATMTPVTPWCNATEGTMVAEFLFPYAPTFSGSVVAQDLFRLDDGASTNYASIRMVRQSAVVLYCDCIVVAGGVSVFDGPNSSFSANQVCKLALAYKSGDYGTSFNGGAVTTGAGASVPSGINRLLMGGANGGAYIRRVSYYPTRLSNATLQALTA